MAIIANFDSHQTSDIDQQNLLFIYNPFPVFTKRSWTWSRSEKQANSRRTLRCSVLPPPLQLGNITLDPPFILSPMAGVTTFPFRKLCARYGAALYVSEMLLAKHVAEGKDDSRARFGPDEYPRSAQLYGTDPGVMAAAAERLIVEQKVNHIDLNFGCPVPKIIKKGGGAAIPSDPKLLQSIVSSVVDVARPRNVPVTAKIRLGLDWMSLNYHTTGKIIQDSGASAITLHARTASDMYIEGAARRSWIHIAALQGVLDIPVIGNGDVFTATDALRLMQLTKCAGVAIGRACLGRPWLFADLANSYRLRWASEVTVPEFQVVADTMMEHLESEVAWQVTHGMTEDAAVKSMRKWFAWYWRGYNGFPHGWVPRMCKETTVAGIRAILAEADPANISYDYHLVVGKRGKFQYPDKPHSEPKLPDPPKKSASQRLPKTEKGIKQRAMREAARRAEYEERVKNVLEYRRKKAEPRRRAKAKTVQEEIANRPVRTGVKPVPRRKKKPAQIADPPLSAAQAEAAEIFKVFEEVVAMGDLTEEEFIAWQKSWPDYYKAFDADVDDYWRR